MIWVVKELLALPAAPPVIPPAELAPLTEELPLMMGTAMVGQPGVERYPVETPNGGAPNWAFTPVGPSKRERTKDNPSMYPICTRREREGIRTPAFIERCRRCL